MNKVISFLLVAICLFTAVLFANYVRDDAFVGSAVFADRTTSIDCENSSSYMTFCTEDGTTVELNMSAIPCDYDPITKDGKSGFKVWAYISGEYFEWFALEKPVITTF